MASQFDWKKIIALLAVVLVFSLLVMPAISSAAKAGESCDKDSECDGDLECIDGTCEGAFMQFFEDDLGGWIGIAHMVVIFLLILGATMTGVEAAFGERVDKKAWLNMIGIAIAIGGTIWMHTAGWIEWLFNWGIGVFAAVIVGILIFTILYIFLARMHKAGAEHKKAKGEKEEAKGEYMEKMLNRVKKKGKVTYKMSKEVAEDIGKMKDGLEDAKKRLERMSTDDEVKDNYASSGPNNNLLDKDDFKGMVKDAKKAKKEVDKVKDAGGDFKETMEELQEAIGTEVKWLKKGFKVWRIKGKTRAEKAGIPSANVLKKARRYGNRALEDIGGAVDRDIAKHLTAAENAIGHLLDPIMEDHLTAYANNRGRYLTASGFRTNDIRGKVPEDEIDEAIRALDNSISELDKVNDAAKHAKRVLKKIYKSVD